jgi:hypothetical protein
MSQPKSAGYFHNGMPYNRSGRGPRPLVVFQGLMLENKPMPRIALGMYKFLEDDYTVYSVLRKEGLPRDHTLPHALPRNGSRHSQCAAQFVSKYGSSRWRQTVPARCADVLCRTTCRNSRYSTRAVCVSVCMTA